MNTLTKHEPIDVPPPVATCPICDGTLIVVDCDRWTENGEFLIPEHIAVECVEEPDIESENWDDWSDVHYQTPYIDWLPISLCVLEWFKAHYRYEKK